MAKKSRRARLSPTQLFDSIMANGTVVVCDYYRRTPSLVNVGDTLPGLLAEGCD